MFGTGESPVLIQGIDDAVDDVELLDRRMYWFHIGSPTSLICSRASE